MNKILTLYHGSNQVIEVPEFGKGKEHNDFGLRKSRNDEANQSYSRIIEDTDNGLYILDIVRGELKNDDPRIPRNIP